MIDTYSIHGLINEIFKIVYKIIVIYPDLYQQLNIEDFFKEIYVSDSIKVLVLKEKTV